MIVATDIIKLLRDKESDFMQEYHDCFSQENNVASDIEFTRGKLNAIAELIIEVSEKYDLELEYDNLLEGDE